MRKVCAVLAVAAMPVLFVGTVQAGGGGGCAHDGDIAREAKGIRVTMEGVCFTPTNLWVQPGQTVTWVNNGSVDHTVTGPAFRLNAELKPGSSYRFQFDNVGVFSYMCQYHPGMSGVVVVGNPKAPATTIDAPAPNAGVSGEILEATPQPVAAAAPAQPADSTDAGTVAGVGALSGATLGALGFALGRRRRPAP